MGAWPAQRRKRTFSSRSEVRKLWVKELNRGLSSTTYGHLHPLTPSPVRRDFGCPGRTSQRLDVPAGLKDTVHDPSSLDVPLLAEVQLDELAEAAGVVVVNRPGVPERLHDGAAERRPALALAASGAASARTHLLSSRASSTWEVRRVEEASRESWLMQDRNLRISLVLSVFPAPLSPLTEQTQGGGCKSTDQSHNGKEFQILLDSGRIQMTLHIFYEWTKSFNSFQLKDKNFPEFLEIKLSNRRRSFHLDAARGRQKPGGRATHTRTHTLMINLGLVPSSVLLTAAASLP